jgi:hypothetical protein
MAMMGDAGSDADGDGRSGGDGASPVAMGGSGGDGASLVAMGGSGGDDPPSVAIRKAEAFAMGYTLRWGLLHGECFGPTVRGPVV